MATHAHATGHDVVAGEQQSAARTWVLKLTGVVLVIPALLNSAHDIWVALLDLPRTEQQRQNERLYRDYFGKQPVQAIPVTVKSGQGATIEAKVSVWDKGDVLVEYGTFTQWFPFPGIQAPRRAVSTFSLVRAAHAQPVPVPLKGQGPYVQSDSLDQGALVRERAFRNGVVEKSSIDPRTGQVLSTSTMKSAPTPAVQARPAIVEAAPITVDLTSMRAAATPTARESLRAGLAWCQSKSNFFSRNLCEYRERQKYCKDGDADTIPQCKP